MTKRDAMRIKISDDGYFVTFPPALSIFAKSEGYKPADFDRRIEISGGAAAWSRSTKIRCWRPCLISSRSCPGNEMEGAIVNPLRGAGGFNPFWEADTLKSSRDDAQLSEQALFLVF
jgi:hypothetical protein